MKRFVVALIAVITLMPTVSFAKCSDEIKAIQGQAAGKDAVTKPGNQNATSTTGSSTSEGGGQTSASAKVLEAQAHDQRGDEDACMKAIEAAKAQTK